MRWVFLLAACVVGSLVVAGGHASAQTAPGAPTISTVTATSLTVGWSAPSDDGGSPITAYDLRYIKSDAADKTDGNWLVEEPVWTSGDLTYVLTELDDGVTYDVEVRAVNASGNGPWSATSTATTTEHGGSISIATAFSVGSSVRGRIDPADDEDFFKIVLAADTDLWLYTTGDLDTVGELLDEDGVQIWGNDDGQLPHGSRNFAMQVEVPAGTYSVKVTSWAERAVGSYVLFAKAVTAPGSTIQTATLISPDTLATAGIVIPGRLEFAGGLNFFRIELESPADLWLRAVGLTDTVGQLLDEDENVLFENDDGDVSGSELGFVIRAEVGAGTYYVRVSGYGAEHGPYGLVARTAAPGDSMESATPLVLNAPEPGRISSAGDSNYFSITLPEEVVLTVNAIAHGEILPLTSTFFDDQGDELDVFTIDHDHWAAVGQETVSFAVRQRLNPGTYLIQIVADPTDTGPYIVHPQISTREIRYGERCTAFDSSRSDPFYGCQWHLNNSGQYPDGAMQDINVEEVWDTTMGEGINVAVVDDGMEYTHTDLAENVLTERNRAYVGDDVWRLRAGHGTSVAGLIAASANEIGVRGVAPEASIYAYNLIAEGTPDDRDEADAMTLHVADTAVYNNSWGPPDVGGLAYASATWELAVEQGVTEGYEGKGALYVWAAGNGHNNGDRATLDGRLNHYSVVPVCAVNYDDVRSEYSELGSNLWICGPSSDAGAALPGIVTTANLNAYTASFGGTSAAAPIVSGVVALVRAVNPDLTWRDVKLILAGSARKNDPSDEDWEEGAIEYGPSTDRYWFNHQYGFGMVDAGAAAALAAGWTELPPMREISASSYEQVTVPDASENAAGSTVSTSLTIDPYVDFIEFVSVEVTMTHTWFRDLHIEVESPSGAVSVLTVHPPAVIHLIILSRTVLDGSYSFGSSKHLGESAAGEWKLRLRDEGVEDEGTLYSWKVTAYGHGSTPGFPEIISATPGATSIDVDWLAPDDTGASAITGYDLRYIRFGAPDGSSWTVLEDVGASDSLSHELTGLTAGVRYHLQVRAVSDSGPGPWSETLAGDTTPVTPEAPTITNVSSAVFELGLSWDHPNVGTAGLLRYDARHIRSDATDKADANWTALQGIWNTGDGEPRATIANLLNGVEYDVQVRAVNTAATGPWSSTRTGTPEAVNYDPEFQEMGTVVRRIRENGRAHEDVGPPILAIDPDGDTLDYNLATPHNDFYIVRENGQLRTRRPLDREYGGLYFLRVEVRDYADVYGLFDDSVDDIALVRVEVEDVNETPTVVGPSHVPIEENSKVYVGRYAASDPEGESTTWSLAGPDKDHFQITVNGDLALTALPDFEARADADGNNRYEVVVGASDGELTGTRDVTVVITGVDEAPTITGERAFEFAENDTRTLGSYSATDPERRTVILSLSGPDAGDFTLSGGLLSFTTVPNFEAPDDANTNNVYEVTVEAADASNTARLPVTVTVTNEDEAGTLSLSSEQPQVGAELAATLTDLDGGISGRSWTWARSQDGSTWTDINGASGRRYTPVETDEGQLLRVAVEYTDHHNSGKRLEEAANDRVRPAPITNEPPVFDNAVMTREVDENTPAGRPVGSPVQATDPDADDQDKLQYMLGGPDAGSFTIDTGTGQIRVGATTVLDHESRGSHTVSVTAADPSTATASTTVTITVAGVNEPPVATDAVVDTDEDTPISIDVLGYVDDPEGDDVRVTLHERPARGSLELDAATSTATYTPRPDTNGLDSFTYSAADDGNLRSARATVAIRVAAVNDAPHFTEVDPERAVWQSAAEGDPVGAPVAATDVDDEPLTLAYSLLGPGASFFEVGVHTGQITVAPGAVLDAVSQPEHTVTVVARDRLGATAEIEVTITVIERPVTLPVIFIGGGGGGGPSGPTPSEIEFEWNVSRDIDELDSGHDVPTGLWSDGSILIIGENGSGADDAVYVYLLENGERQQGREFELDEGNLAPRGLWSDGTTIWISDSGKDKLFAHDLKSGERLPDSDLALHPDNDDARGIWSDGSTMWVLDDRDDALFGYDLASGELLGEYALDSANDDPHGIFSDGASVWVSNHDPKRLFAYRLPVLDAQEDTAAENLELERVRDEEFDKLSRASNNSPRGIWSDGDVMYVADASDHKVYSYNMPDAIDARLASLTLSDVEIGEFSPGQTEYEGVAADGVTVTTVEAAAVQDAASVAIEPHDSDEATDGHQVTGAGGSEITITVTSADESRTQVYRVHIGGAAGEEQEPTAACLRGAVTVGFGLLVSGGGSVEDLAACAQSRSVTALYVPHEGEYVPYILGAPAFVNEAFVALYPEGIAPLTPLIAKSEGPPSADPAAGGEITEPWPDCLRGGIATGFSLVLYEGGSVEDLDSCAQSRDISAVYALVDGEYTPYILGAPGFVNEDFAAVFPDGLPAATPLVAQSEGLSTTGSSE